MKKALMVLLPTAVFSVAAMAGGAESSCMAKDCAAGTKAVTYATKKDFLGIRKRLLIRCCRSASTFQF
jgi:hypothetical protein